jgi:uncharacterized protein (DUF433 family)
MAASTKPFSMRLAPATLGRLDRQARSRGETKTRVGERLIEEGLRMADHPSIVFRDGPAGRRAALVGGPDVWEVIGTLQSSGLKGEEAIDAAVEWGALTRAQVDAALRYYGDYPSEIDNRIRQNLETADREYAAWQRAQKALA